MSVSLLTAAFANATAHAAKRLGMGGYVHWWGNVFSVPFLH